MSEIDVTKCENYKLGFSGYICIDPNLRNDCSLNNNCKFKQLKRSEAQLEGMFVSHTDLEMKYKAKEQECEELKKANIHIDNNRMVKSNKLKKIEEYCREQNLKADYTAYKILRIIDEVE